jgi:peptidyl-prolyl cis-trans isomerase C
MRYPARVAAPTLICCVASLAVALAACAERKAADPPAGQKASPKTQVEEKAAAPTAAPKTEAPAKTEPLADKEAPAKTEAPAKADEPAAPARGGKTPQERRVQDVLPPPEAPAPSEGVVAWFGEQRVTAAEFEEYLVRLPVFQRREYASLEKKKELLKNLIQFNVIAQKARSEGIDKDPQVQIALKTEMAKRYFQIHYGEEASVEVAEQEIRERYDRDSAIYNKPERVRASHILIKEVGKARKVLQELKSKLAGPEADLRRIFREFVKLYSEDELTKMRGGDLLFFTREGTKEGEGETIDPAVVEAAFAMQNTDQVSGLVEGRDGFHILLLANRREKVQKTFEEVRAEIRLDLAREKLDRQRREFMAALVDFDQWNMDLRALDRVKVEAAPEESEVKARLDSIGKAPEGGAEKTVPAPDGGKEP